MMKNSQRRYFPSAAQMIDRLCIVTLKSIKISANKKEYEAEASEIMHDLDLLLGKNQGRLIRAVLVNAIINETIWANEAAARGGNDRQGKRLLLTHSLNSVRAQSMNVISAVAGGRRDLKLDYMSPALTKKYGYDFAEVLR
jgi:hypothetical protein